LIWDTEALEWEKANLECGTQENQEMELLGFRKEQEAFSRSPDFQIS
jgi:hypothetical protein